VYLFSMQFASGMAYLASSVSKSASNLSSGSHLILNNLASSVVTVTRIILLFKIIFLNVLK
jgi:hypothetical protein